MVVENTVPLTEGERRSLCDLVMLSLQALLESLLGHPVDEARFEFAFPEPLEARMFRDLYHGKVRFDCQENACLIPERWLSIESPFCEPTMHSC